MAREEAKERESHLLPGDIEQLFETSGLIN
jgi:hypothetical protein